LEPTEFLACGPLAQPHADTIAAADTMAALMRRQGLRPAPSIWQGSTARCDDRREAIRLPKDRPWFDRPKQPIDQDCGEGVALADRFDAARMHSVGLHVLPFQP
jgi:hypothetical protein